MEHYICYFSDRHHIVHLDYQGMPFCTVQGVKDPNPAVSGHNSTPCQIANLHTCILDKRQYSGSFDCHQTLPPKMEELDWSYQGLDNSHPIGTWLNKKKFK